MTTGSSLDGQAMPAPGALARALLLLSRHTPLGRGLMRKWIGNAYHALHDGAVESRFHGQPVRLHPRGNVAEFKALFRPDVFDAREIAFLQDAMRGPGGTFLDIGANAGLYGVAVSAAAGEGATVLAVEPNPVLAARVRDNIRLNSRARSGGVRFLLAETALDEAEGSMTLHVPDQQLGSGSLNAVDGPAETFSVPVTTLHQLLTSCGITAVRAMKIDVEGVEDRILMPFLAQADRALLPARIIIEHLSRPEWRSDVIARLLEAGYEIRFTTRNNHALELPGEYAGRA